MKPIPAGALAVPDAEQLQRILKRGKPVTMHLTLVSAERLSGHSGNVIAEVPGRDPKLRRSCWSAAISTAGTSAPARSTTAPASRSRPPRPSTSWTPAGRCGPSASSGSAPKSSACSAASPIRSAHGQEPHYALAESDFGADRIWRVNSKLGKDREAEARAARRPRSRRSASFPERIDDADGPDIEPD